jgi:rod shape determining protein RodA
VDIVVLLCVFGMNAMSLVTLYAASDAYGIWYFRSQIISTVLGVTAMVVIMFLDYDAWFQKLKFIFPILTVVLIVYVKYFGVGQFGNRNWIVIPRTNFSIQPTEFTKISFIIPFAMHLDAVRDKINHPLSVLGLVAHGGLVCGMVFWQGDDGMGLVYLGIFAIMLFGSGISLWYFGGAGLAGVLVAPQLWKRLTAKQQNRVLFGFNPDLDPLNAGYQAIRSRACIIAGGFRGAGMKGGIKYFSLVQGQSDFLYAVVAEKFGFFGTFLYLVLILVLIVRILWIARSTRKNYASYICIGIAGMLFVQAAENIGMCLAILPVVGITCPFLSYGSSSILSMYICMGIVESICTHRQKYYFEREEE